MDIQNVWSVASKDFETIRRKRSIMGYLVGLPLLLAVAFSLVVRNNIVSSSGISSSASLGLESLTYFFVIFAAVLPTSIAAYSIVGEKVEKSLEPLLATPMTDREILLGKIIAALVPPVLSTWVGASIFMAASDYLLYGGLSYYYFPDWVSGIMLLLLAPLAALLGIEVAVILSSRLTDVRGANQLGGLIWIPFMVVFIYAVEGTIAFDIGTLLTISGIVLIIDVVLFFVSTTIFRRDQILTKWK